MTFKAAMSRAYRWQRRYKIVLRAVTSLQNNQYDPNIAADFVNLVNQTIQDEGYPLNCIANIDETNMYYDMTANVTLACQGQCNVVI
jgi:hypothetical protein